MNHITLNALRKGQIIATKKIRVSTQVMEEVMSANDHPHGLYRRLRIARHLEGAFLRGTIDELTVDEWGELNDDVPTTTIWKELPELADPEPPRHSPQAPQAEAADELTAIIKENRKLAAEAELEKAETTPEYETETGWLRLKNGRVQHFYHSPPTDDGHLHSHLHSACDRIDDRANLINDPDKKKCQLCGDRLPF